MVTLPQLSRQDVASCLLMNHKEGNLEENLQYICIHPTTPAPLCWDVRCEILAPLRVKILVWVVLDSNGALSGACLVFKGIIYQPRAMLQRCTKSRYVFTECGILAPMMSFLSVSGLRFCVQISAGFFQCSLALLIVIAPSSGPELWT